MENLNYLFSCLGCRIFKSVQISIPQLSTTIVFCTWSGPMSHRCTWSGPISFRKSTYIHSTLNWVKCFTHDLIPSLGPSLKIDLNPSKNGRSRADPGPILRSDPSLVTKHEPLESLPICNLIQAQIKKEPRWIEPFWMEMKVSFSPSVHITNNSLVFHPNTVWILAY